MLLFTYKQTTHRAKKVKADSSESIIFYLPIFFYVLGLLSLDCICLLCLAKLVRHFPQVQEFSQKCKMSQVFQFSGECTEVEVVNTGLLNNERQ